MVHETARALSPVTRPQRRLEDLHGAEVFAAIASLLIMLVGFLNA